VAATPTKAYGSFLSKLTQRFNEGWYDYLKETKNSLEAPRFTKEEVEKLPESFVNKKSEFLEEIKKYERQEKILRESLEEYNEIQEAVSTSDGRLAYQLMRDLKDGGSSDFEIETPTIL
jgi:benzoyl-CoA reductase/2-hydroxyglutaryl-CoA dehydratase subunit BcrC/BadD/HgdB